MVHPWKSAPRWPWESLRLAYKHEAIRRTHHEHPSLADTSYPPIFEPGEIAYAPRGGIGTAYYQFLETRGYELSARERAVRASISRWRGGKYCLVVDRVGVDAYWICYITSFTAATDARTISSPVGRYFSLALGLSPPWPPDFEAVQTRPHWNTRAYIVAMPVLVQNMLRVSKTRFALAGRRTLLQAGDLARVREQIVQKVQAFDQISKQFRADQTKWDVQVQKAGGAHALDFYEDKAAQRTVASGANEGFILRGAATQLPNQGLESVFLVKADPTSLTKAEQSVAPEVNDPSPGDIEDSTPSELKKPFHPEPTESPSASSARNLPSTSPATSFQIPSPNPWQAPSRAARLSHAPPLEDPGSPDFLTHLLGYLPHDTVHSYRSLSAGSRLGGGKTPVLRDWRAYNQSMALLDRGKPKASVTQADDWEKRERAQATLLARRPPTPGRHVVSGPAGGNRHSKPQNPKSRNGPLGSMSLSTAAYPLSLQETDVRTLHMLARSLRCLLVR